MSPGDPEASTVSSGHPDQQGPLTVTSPGREHVRPAPRAPVVTFLDGGKYPVPQTLDTGLRALMLCAAAQSSNPHRVQPQPTLLGARESDETTLPLLNRAILWSFSSQGTLGTCSGNLYTDRV